MMDAAQIVEFLSGRSIYGLDPQTRMVVACVDYGTDGTCRARFLDGETDNGMWGVEGDTYWTQYTRFREGARHVFRLDPVGDGVAQAYFADGTIAFLQSHSETP